jgi:molybdopterin-guanine dinucleotide biosynthesis protein A
MLLQLEAAAKGQFAAPSSAKMTELANESRHRHSGRGKIILMEIQTRDDVTLGILAGGRALRLGGLDKAWLQRDGVAQVVRLACRFEHEVHGVLVSANRHPDRYQAHGLSTVADTVADAGPIGGLDALARSCTTPWLLTLPVDVIGVNECLLRTLIAEAGPNGSFAADEDGQQPLVALWRVDALRRFVAAAIERHDSAIHDLQDRLGLRQVRFAGVRFGNLNTPADLTMAGIRAFHE